MGEGGRGLSICLIGYYENGGEGFGGGGQVFPHGPSLRVRGFAGVVELYLNVLRDLMEGRGKRIFL